MAIESRHSHLIDSDEQVVVDLLADSRVELVRWMGPHKVS